MECIKKLALIVSRPIGNAMHVTSSPIQALDKLVPMHAFIKAGIHEWERGYTNVVVSTMSIGYI